MGIVNGFVLSFITKHPYKKTYLRVQASERRFVCSWDKNFLLLVKALKQLLAILDELFMCFEKVCLWTMVILH